MKRLTIAALGMLFALMGSARAADLPTKQEGRVWIYQPLVLAFSPNWSLTSMPGGRVEFFRSREGKAGFHFLEYFFGPNYTLKTGNFTFKTSLHYYYMGYPNRGRTVETPPGSGTLACAGTPNCATSYNASHNIEIIPSIEYRTGKWSFYDRVILHNTFYADTYVTSPVTTKSTDDLRWGLGTVLRNLMQVRYAATDRLGIILSDEPFFGIIEDGDTRDLKDAKGNPGAGYKPTGYWKRGYRLNRTYVGIDYKVTPSLTVVPMYMVEVMSSPTEGSDVTDISHNLFMTISYVAKLFE
jgi:hypothetical protein